MNPDWTIMGTEKACKTCDGFGTLREVVKRRFSSGYGVKEIECPDCGGSGRK